MMFNDAMVAVTRYGSATHNMIGVDGMITVVAHELTETITNSDGAWFDDRGYENAGEINIQLTKLTYDHQ